MPPIQQMDGGTLHIPHGYPYGHQWREFMNNSSSTNTVTDNNNDGGGTYFLQHPPPPGFCHNVGGWNSNNRLISSSKFHQQHQDSGMVSDRSPVTMIAPSPVNSSISSSPPLPDGKSFFEHNENIHSIGEELSRV